MALDAVTLIFWCIRNRGLKMWWL